MFITTLFDRILGRKANPALASLLLKEQSQPLPRIHIVALAPSGTTDALAKALESTHFTDIKA